MSRRNKDYNFWSSAYGNNMTYRQYYNRLMELALAMFEWKNLPDTVDERFLEMTLFTRGNALFFKDEELGYLCLPSNNLGKYNVYNIPIKRRAFANNGYHINKNINDSVVIYNNFIRTNSTLDTEMFARRLANLDRTIDVNANAQKTPILIKCKDSDRLTVANAYKEYQGNSPVIFATEDFDPTTFQVLNTSAPYVCDKLYTLKTEIWNEALTYLGIMNLNVVKKERLISDEVKRNEGGVVASRYSRLEARRQACDKINKMFGLNIECNYREDFQTFADETASDTYTGDSKNEGEVNE